MRTAIEIDWWTDLFGALVERFPQLWRRFGDPETRLLREGLAEVQVESPIYIAGLARSGSTILLELLDRHRDTATHRYRDFPMLFTPWAWNWFVDRAGESRHAARERAHRDRIWVTPDSPEAFEEVLWMAFFHDLHDPGRDAVLDGAARHPTFEAFYRDHLRKILLLRQASRYLAKGNYNVTRFGYLKKLFPDARFLVPIRDPLWHVASLMKQHVLFTTAAAEDHRVRRHLRRSGHFEFGPDRREICIGDGAAAEEVRRLWRDGEEVAGWAALWAAVYRHVDEARRDPTVAEALLVVRYEDLCADPGATMARILGHCSLADDGLSEHARAAVSPPDYYRPSFSAAERDIIAARAAPVAAIYGYR